MADVACFEMPMEAGLELGAIIGLDDQQAKGQASGMTSTWPMPMRMPMRATR